MRFWEENSDGFLLRIKLTPSASFCGFGDVFIDATGTAYLKTYVRSVPEKGKANDELLKMLAKTLKISKKNLQLVYGATDHFKKIRITAAPTDDITNKLNELGKD